MLVRRNSGEIVSIMRLLLGIAALVKIFHITPILEQVLQDGAPRLPYMSQVPLLPIELFPLLLGAWAGAAVMFGLGHYGRAPGIVLSLILSYVLLLDQQLYGNHFYLLLLTVVLVTLAGSPRVDGTVPYWPVLLMKLQLTSVYLFASLSKLNGAFLSGTIIGEASHFPVTFASEVFILVSLATIATELFLAFAFWSSRLRGTAAAIGGVYHVFLMLFIGDTFALSLLVLALVSFSLYVPFFTDRIDTLAEGRNERVQVLAKAFSLMGLRRA